MAGITKSGLDTTPEGQGAPFKVSSEELTLDLVEPKDIEAIVRACQDPEIQRFTSVPVPYRPEDAEHFVGDVNQQLWSEGGANWAIRREPGDLIGVLSLRNRGENTADVGYWMIREARGQGLMTKAVRLGLDQAFHRLGFQCVTWQAHPENLASRKVAWASGFTFGSVVRGIGFGRQQREDRLIASILKNDPRQPQGTWNDALLIGRCPNPRDPEALVRQFHETYNLPVVTTGPNIENERMHMRLSLILEETSELVRALYGTKAYDILQNAFKQLRDADESARDIVEVADALADLTYVVYGMALEAGISLPAVLAEVQASNMSKLGSDGKPIYRDDGKVLKGPGFFPPNIRRGLEEKIAPSHVR